MGKVRAFTLIELLVVIAIIAILATLVVTRYTAAVINSRNVKAKNDVTAMVKAVEQYKLDESNPTGKVAAPHENALTVFNPVTGDTGHAYETLSEPCDREGYEPVFTIEAETLCYLFMGRMSYTAKTYGAMVRATPGNAYKYYYGANGPRNSIRDATNDKYIIGATLVELGSSGITAVYSKNGGGLVETTSANLDNELNLSGPSALYQ